MGTSGSLSGQTTFEHSASYDLCVADDTHRGRYDWGEKTVVGRDVVIRK